MAPCDGGSMGLGMFPLLCNAEQELHLQARHDSPPAPVCESATPEHWRCLQQGWLVGLSPGAITLLGISF